MASEAKKESYADLPHVLIVDDDKRICDLVARYLIREGYVTMSAHNADEARLLLENFIFDIAVMDVMMPGESGLELLQSLKQEAKIDIPVLMLTALGDVQDRLHGFEAGADDYLPKPFEPKELAFRLDAILRRTRKLEKSERTFQIGQWVFVPLSNTLQSDEESKSLTDMEGRLLTALANHNGEVVTREELAKLCDIDGGDRAVDVQVTRLRRKIEVDTKAPKYLQTMRGKGYLLRAELLS